MTVSVGDKLPEATLLTMTADGPAPVALSERLAGRKVAIFAVPGAFTPTCHSAHVPSFIRTKDDFAAKGVDEIICISVNDPFVMGAWGRPPAPPRRGSPCWGTPRARLPRPSA